MNPRPGASRPPGSRGGCGPHARARRAGRSRGPPRSGGNPQASRSGAPIPSPDARRAREGPRRSFHRGRARGSARRTARPSSTNASHRRPGRTSAACGGRAPASAEETCSPRRRKLRRPGAPRFHRAPAEDTAAPSRPRDRARSAPSPACCPDDNCRNENFPFRR